MALLKDKFRLLQEQSGSNRENSAPLALLKQRLARQRPRRQVQRPCDRDLAAAIGGTRLHDGLIGFETLIPYGARHGHSLLQRDRQCLDYFGFGADSEPIFLDTETSGLAGGTGTVVFVIGLARFSERGLLLRQYLLTAFGGEPAMLAEAAAFLSGAGPLITYNGKCFDQPLLQTRYRLLQLDDPFAAMAHWDLLHSVRRAFASRWPDCQLRRVEQRLLGFQRNNDLSGAQVPQVWVRWLRHGDSSDLGRVLKHNMWDLVSLAKAASVLPESFQKPARYGADALAAARLYIDKNEPQAALLHLIEQRARLDHKAQLLLAQLAFSLGRNDIALASWNTLAAADNQQALARLAKFHEHQRRDFESALKYTERLTRLAPDNKDHQHRLQRLQRKLSRKLSIA